MKRTRLLLPLIIFLASLFGAPPVEAGTANVNCTAPLTYTNGTAIPAGTAITYKLYRGTSAAAASAATSASITNTSCAFTDSSAVDGATMFYAVTATVGGVESAKTNPVSVVIPSLMPNPPSNVTVTAVVAGANVAPVFRINADGSRGTAVLGFVDVGTTCGTTASPVVYKYRGRPYRRVDPAAVKWWATTPTTSAAVACG